MIKPRILVVDDMPKNIQLVGNLLSGKNFDLAFAQNGASALEMVKKIPFHLILLDIMMPDMSGFEVCKKLKEDPQNKDIPIIFLTAKNDHESIEKAFNLGGVDYVTKPFNALELIARVETHIKLYAQKNELIESNLAKDKFFSIIAHDLQSPFAGILGYFEYIMKPESNYNQVNFNRILTHSYENFKETYELLKNLLDWSRSQLNTIVYTPVLIDLKEITDSVIKLYRKKADEKGLQITNNINTETELFADQQMVLTILRNILSNAIKFTNDGGRILISTEKNNNSLMVYISDTGIGISESKIDSLFKIKPNYTSQGTSGERGTGLGLVICKEFMEKNMGTISVKSSEGNGTTFTLTFPV